MKFSERLGITTVESVLQVGEMNDDLRNSLWNVLDIFMWGSKNFVFSSYGQAGIFNFSHDLWFHYFKKPVDSRPDYGNRILEVIRDYYFHSEWYEVYEFLEYILVTEKNSRLIKIINEILDRELSGYRFIDSVFVPVTDEVEIEAIKQAINEGPYKGVHAHLKKALEHLSSKDSPDYRNSIKESISAVESMAKELTGNPKATLGAALSILEKDNKLHAALKSGFSSLYGYTSDEGGIRHAMLNEPDITVSDAKFFLVSCSAFINYLKSSI